MHKFLSTTFFSFSFFFIGSAFAQNADWSVGTGLGLTNYQGDLVSSLLFEPSETKLAGSLFIRKKFTESFSAKFNFLGGRLAGSDANSQRVSRMRRGFSFKTKIYEPSLIVELNLPTGEFSPFAHLYVFIGLGITFFDPENDFNLSRNAGLDLFDRIERDIREIEDSKSALSIPIGLGLKRDLNEKIYLGAEFSYRMMASDYLDGVSHSGNPQRNDWWLSFSIQGAYRFALSKDSDGDGIPDQDDKCPRDPGPKSMSGCPDTDGDGVTDRKDNCPELPGPQDLKGCPDSDGDSIVDNMDRCPSIAGSKALGGCPDSDGDGIIDMEDQCPNAAGLRALSGCPDSDGDGISDPNDNCPRERGTLENLGCPEQ